jgi:SAM-dependent methyltransferase
MKNYSPDLVTEKRRRSTLAKLAKGKILDVGYNETPNDFLKGAIGFDKNIWNKPGNYSKFVQGDCCQLSKYFREKSFDTIIAGETIEHLENPSQFLREAKKVLKDNGLLLISTPNPYNILTMFANIFFKKPSYASHINLFTFRTMIELCNYTGWKCEKVSDASGGINIWAKKRDFFLPFPKPFCYQFIYVLKKNE